MDQFLEFLSSKWAVITGIILAAIGVGVREHKLYSVDKAQQAHEKLHKDSQFITLQMCTLNQKKMEQLSQAKFDAGAQQFQDIKNLIAANDAELFIFIVFDSSIKLLVVANVETRLLLEPLVGSIDEFFIVTFGHAP